MKGVRDNIISDQSLNSRAQREKYNNDENLQFQNYLNPCDIKKNHFNNDKSSNIEEYNKDIEELDPELNHRLEKINFQNQNVNTLDNLVSNFKKNLQHLQSKIEKKEKYKLNYHVLSSKTQDLERENERLRDDYLKACQDVKIKENLLNEFQDVLEKTKNKFRGIEEENKNLRKENEYLRPFLEDLKNNLNEKQMNEKKDKEIILNLNNFCDENENLIKNLEKKNFDCEKFYQSKIQNLENKIRHDFLEEIDFLNNTSLENEELRNKIQLSESSLKQNEIEFSNIIQNKNYEIDNLTKFINEIQVEFRSLEEQSENKINELIQKLNNQNEELNHLIKEDEMKSHLINEIENDLKNQKHLTNNLQDEKYKLNHNIKQYEDLINDLNMRFQELSKQLNLMSSELNSTKQENEKLLKEKNDLLKNFEILENKTSELKNCVSEKDIKLTKEIQRERKTREISEKTNRKLIKELDEADEVHLIEIQNLKNSFQNQIESINKENQFSIKQLIEIRQICTFIEKNFLTNNLFNQNQFYQISQAFKDIIFKIELILKRKDEKYINSINIDVAPVKSFK